MSYTAMILMILAILSALLGFGPEGSPVLEGARVLAACFAVLCVMAIALPHLRRRQTDEDEA